MVGSSSPVTLQQCSEKVCNNTKRAVGGVWNDDDDSTDDYFYDEYSNLEYYCDSGIIYDDDGNNVYNEEFDDYFGDRWDVLWDELSFGDRAAWKVLGWTKELWDDVDGTVPSDNKMWSELTPAEQEAAEWLGYDQAAWDNKTNNNVLGSVEVDENHDGVESKKGSSEPCLDDEECQSGICWSSVCY